MVYWEIVCVNSYLQPLLFWQWCRFMWAQNSIDALGVVSNLIQFMCSSESVSGWFDLYAVHEMNAYGIWIETHFHWNRCQLLVGLFVFFVASFHFVKFVCCRNGTIIKLLATYFVLLLNWTNSKLFSFVHEMCLYRVKDKKIRWKRKQRQTGYNFKRKWWRKIERILLLMPQKTHTHIQTINPEENIHQIPLRVCLLFRYEMFTIHKELWQY